MAIKQNVETLGVKMPFQKYQKRTGDLIHDAEIEAEVEIHKKIRNKNTQALLIAFIGVGLVFVAYQSMQNQDLISALLGPEETQLAEIISSENIMPAFAPETPAETIVSENPKPEPQLPISQNANPIDAVMNQGGFPLNGTPKIIKINGNADSMASMTAAERAALTISKALEPRKNLETSQPSQPVITQSMPVVAPSPPASPQPAQPKLAAFVAGETHFIQLGAFLIKANSDQLIKNLESKGFAAFSHTRTVKASMHVAFIGGFSDQSSGQTLLNDLKSKGFEPFFKENPDSTYDMILGKFVFKNSAEDFRKDLNKQGILTNVKRMRIDARQYVVRMEGLPSKAAALLQQKELETEGFKTALIGLSSKSI